MTDVIDFTAKRNKIKERETDKEVGSLLDYSRDIVLDILQYQENTGYKDSHVIGIILYQLVALADYKELDVEKLTDITIKSYRAKHPKGVKNDEGTTNN